MKRICKQCGKEYEIKHSEIEFYKSKQLQLPKRCKECRDLNKQEKGKKIKEQQKVDMVQENIIEPNVISENIIERTPNNVHKKSNWIRGIIGFFILLLFGTGVYGQWNREEIPQPQEQQSVSSSELASSTYEFRNDKLGQDHFEKHGSEFSYTTYEEYVMGANKVLEDKNVLHKKEAEDNDDVYYLEKTNELVIVSTDGFLRTYFKPNDGLAYFNRQ